MTLKKDGKKMFLCWPSFRATDGRNVSGCAPFGTPIIGPLSNASPTKHVFNMATATSVWQKLSKKTTAPGAHGHFEDAGMGIRYEGFKNSGQFFLNVFLSHSVWLNVFSIFGENMFLPPNFYEALMTSEAE